MKIGIFDSGFGGLSIMRTVVEKLPQYDYVYLGDSARTPYGPRSQEVIYEFTRQAVEFLFEQQDCALVVLACNTASTEALRKIQQKVVPRYQDAGRRVLGVIIPAVEEAVRVSPSGKIGVLATEGSVASGAFVREITERRPDAVVTQQACPMLVPLVETAEENAEIRAQYIARYTQPLKDADVDTVILGCTHYEFLREDIAVAFGDDVQLVCEGSVVAQSLAQYLARHADVTTQLSISGERTFFTTDLSPGFIEKGSAFFGAPIDAQQADID